MKQRDVLFLAISTFVLITAWIGFSIYHNLMSSTITKPVAEKIVPLNPNFDTKTIDSLKEREKIEAVFQTKNKQSSESAAGNVIEASSTITPSTSSANQGENL
ncbi:MAG: hypothetical protein A3H50_00250 [Candidatus Levybacteria bacterium RIFCSPLOWO2_02_FULL_37_10]|nr:MAG: hypothetical protein A2860_03830 [Candidatus Levybacteria bacterium RIFCSPHIGHO2_01_FULL_37_33]OGH15613.1 MAG: hypothetical protein A3C97_01585 [Candidatus Levybacteria bacterium RIFCSPHIGHO2_02_FULL_37_11]OGH30121.1 MAG: hypothetical protein A3F30_01875 [Candidatus Levybacteria bacterium RIFCSPHIGHO2_12_FULL_37_12]OGH32374.1 MAG: hypothetical protein A2953_01870 [Candidatus Levybacteria bacterium RIFCSPLOWO2_01_FULL_36_54]OGH46304.1 MAG: hypothetical protein A3H50_00250 [Candidatus Lev